MSNRRQDYILRVRYHNPLPPPPFPPRLINISNPVKQYALPNFVSNLIQEKKIAIENDAELGMPMDLAAVDGFFEGDTSWNQSDMSGMNLEPVDRSLLKVAGGSGSSHVEVPFLRRTEYISAEVGRNSSTRGNLRLTASTSKAIAEQRGRSLREIPNQIQAIEQTFSAVQQPLENLKHPTKPELKPVGAWNFLPNDSMAGIQHLMLRVSDNLTDRTPTSSTPGEEDVSNRHKVALFMPSSAEGEQYLSYYLPSEESAEKIQQASNNSSSTEGPFLYNLFRNFDASMLVNPSGLEDLCLSICTDQENPKNNKALYTPIYARSTLKRRHVRAPVNPDTIDGIELTLREPNREESVQLKRARYDSFAMGDVEALEKEEQEIAEEQAGEENELNEIEEQHQDENPLPNPSENPQPLPTEESGQLSTKNEQKEDEGKEEENQDQHNGQSETINNESNASEQNEHSIPVERNHQGEQEEQVPDTTNEVEASAPTANSPSHVPESSSTS
ncbi:RNA polymerase II associated Paf1 complex [Schizosaccharomyces cryophilus OY26]|uniref:RNA polymerase II associated Paf1 complex n=1 Tax=Schizosaccharomyces cryophilus (strain OY26 / ATCC MYA-4695 / CBS 11777 / NBRC 106824 / NRRL Y48691) TaxID=653667 RepID=S9X8J9_SCHCR|nr:RNA polymerase II associated Paf1 complex [Schizosaccharomyces cryophilus OY26]EPY53462.1 RNA polymerase II associated Paf1 complex [Schizosaccharomyces cryophilus OY26]